MTNKIPLEIDLTRIDKSRIETKTYTNKEGVEVTQKIYKFEAVELAQPKVIKEGDTWILQQTHFLVDAPTKEEKKAQTKMRSIGRGVGFANKSSDSREENIASITRTLKGDESWVEDIGF